MNRATTKLLAIVLRRSVMRGLLCGLSLVVAAGLFAQTEAPAAGEAIVTDVDGKEYTLSKLKFTTGTKRLAWLADPQGTTEDAKRGPAAIEFREPHSTTLVRGVVTLVPV